MQMVPFPNAAGIGIARQALLGAAVAQIQIQVPLLLVFDGVVFRRLVDQRRFHGGFASFSPCRSRASALDRSQHNSLDEVLLDEGIDHDDRQRGHHGGGHADAVRGDGGRAGLAGRHLLRGGRAGLILIQDLDQNGLHGLQILRRGIQIGVEPAVPLGDGDEEGDGHQDGLGQRQDDFEEDNQVVSAVDAHRLKEGGGH